MAPAPSHWVPRAPWYSGTRLRPRGFAYGAFTPYGRPSQRRSARRTHASCGPIPRRDTRAGLGSSRSARRYSGNHSCFLLLRLLRCFSSPGSPLRTMDACAGTQGPPCVGSPIQTPADHRVFAPPRGFSQLVASFFGLQCQGIRPVPLLAYPPPLCLAWLRGFLIPLLSLCLV